MSGQKQTFSVSFSSHQASGVVKDVFEITPSTVSNIAVRELRLGKIAASLSVGASLKESLLVTVWRGATDADIGGSTIGGVLLDGRRGSTHSFAAQQNASTPGSSAGGAAELLFSQAWNTELPFIWRPVKEERPICKLSQRLQVRLGASSGAIVISGSMIIEELGKMPGLGDS